MSRPLPPLRQVPVVPRPRGGELSASWAPGLVATTAEPPSPRDLRTEAEVLHLDRKLRNRRDRA